MSVHEEKLTVSSHYLGLADHVREVIENYQFREENCRMSLGSPLAANASSVESEQEGYEYAIPAHGDGTFYNFMSTIQENPGQIIRSSRDSSPILPVALNEAVPKCPKCGSETISEVQNLSLTPKLQIEYDNSVPIEFGNFLVYNCLKSCRDTPDKMRTERIIVIYNRNYK